MGAPNGLGLPDLTKKLAHWVAQLLSRNHVWNFQAWTPPPLNKPDTDDSFYFIHCLEYFHQKYFIYFTADGIMVVFSITDEGSFEMLQDLHQQVDRNLKDTVSLSLN